MARARTILAAVMACALAIVPAVAFAAGSKFVDRPDQSQPHKTPSQGAAAHAASDMPCHANVPDNRQKPSGAPNNDTQKTCKHCNGDGGCTADACALKCFKLVGGLPHISTTSASLPVEVFVPVLVHPHDWSGTPPAPPPRA